MIGDRLKRALTQSERDERMTDQLGVQLGPRMDVYLEPDGEPGDRADVICGDCGERIRYPNGKWGEIACGCDEPPGWIIR